jgi:hypothetical protein
VLSANAAGGFGTRRVAAIRRMLGIACVVNRDAKVEGAIVSKISGSTETCVTST